MDWTFRSELPIYSQLVEGIRQGIVSGTLAPGQRLASVRDLAMEAGVNPNTMQRALQELERQGLVYAQRTAGRFVTEDTERIREEKRAMAMVQLRSFRENMARLGLSREEILALLREEEKEEEENKNGDTGM